MKDAFYRLLQRFGLAADARPVWNGGAGACVLLVNRWGVIIDSSEDAACVMGRSRAGLMGARLAELFEAADRAGVERAVSIGGTAGRAAARLSGGDAPGQRLTLMMDERPDGRRGVLAAIAPENAVNDARDHAGDNAAADARALRAEADAARRDAKARADLLADLSHEMRTPLNAVIGFADAMQEETFGPLGHGKYNEYAEHIRASGGHLLDLVSSILDLAKIEAERFTLKRELVDAGAIAAECAGIVRLQAEAAGLNLVTDIAEDLPESSLDPRALRQILINLLANAVKFTSDGEISLSARAEDGDIVLTVTDTGVGMSAAELEKLGARFTAAQGAGVRGNGGAGLGLALAFALAELHGGAMTLSSAPGEGLTARVVLPVEAPAAPRRAHRLAAVDGGYGRAQAETPDVLTQLERIEVYRRERASAA